MGTHVHINTHLTYILYMAEFVGTRLFSHLQIIKRMLQVHLESEGIQSSNVL